MDYEFCSAYAKPDAENKNQIGYHADNCNIKYSI